MEVCLCPSHLISVPTPCFQCVHASVHEYVHLTPYVCLLPMSAPSPMHSLMESCVPLCVTVCLFQSPCLWSHNLFRVCTHISS